MLELGWLKKNPYCEIRKKAVYSLCGINNDVTWYEGVWEDKHILHCVVKETLATGKTRETSLNFSVDDVVGLCNSALDWLDKIGELDKRRG